VDDERDRDAMTRQTAAPAPGAGPRGLAALLDLSLDQAGRDRLRHRSIEVEAAVSSRPASQWSGRRGEERAEDLAADDIAAFVEDRTRGEQRLGGAEDIRPV
jgi:hypothetical protein